MSERKPVLIVVDVQNGFITEDSAPVVPVIVKLVRRWQAAGGPLAATWCSPATSTTSAAPTSGSSAGPQWPTHRTPSWSPNSHPTSGRVQWSTSASTRCSPKVSIR